MGESHRWLMKRILPPSAISSTPTCTGALPLTERRGICLAAMKAGSGTTTMRARLPPASCGAKECDCGAWLGLG